ncbi:MAG: phosphoribosylanthranilate isomerase [Desulfovibrio sp.]|nr:phosphoribosylanthranilate isomerase [Desulfovibrio sp.]
MIIKICGITRREDLEYLSEAGVDYCGFIFHPASPRSISPKDAAAFDSGSLKRVGVFVNQDYDEISRIRNEVGLDYLQLHGDQSRECAEKLGSENVIKVFWPQRYASRSEFETDLDSWAPYCAAFLLDAGANLGGSGKTLDWNALSETKFSRDWFLAGGLNPDNISDSLKALTPAGIDLNSGVEASPGVKDHKKIGEILKIIRSRARHD